MTIIQFIGLIGSIIMVFGAVPQLIKTFKDGHAEGLSFGTLICWLAGMICLLIYVRFYRSTDYILIINYSFNLITTGIFLYYKLFRTHWSRGSFL